MPELVSRTPGGRPANQGLEYPSRPSISGDGDKIAFASPASDLVALDTNDLEDVFVRARSEDTTRRAGENAISPSLSADGNQLAYISAGADGAYRLHLKDLRTGEVQPVVDDGQGHPFTWSNYPQLSGDGRVVLFEANTEQDPNRKKLVLYDRGDGRMEVLDEGSAPASASVCGDGRRLALATSRGPLKGLDTGGWSNIYVRDRQTGESKLITHSPRKTSSRAHKGQWAKARGWSDHPAFSADGNWVAYDSTADNLVPKDKNEHKDIFVTEVATEKTERVSVSDRGKEANDDCFEASISADGRFVSFESRATNLTNDPVNGKKMNLFVRDRKMGRTYLANRGPTGPEGDCRDASLSADGRWLTYTACADPDGPEEAWARHVYVVGNPASEHTQAVSLQAALAQMGAGAIRRLQGAVQIGGVQLPIRLCTTESHLPGNNDGNPWLAGRRTNLR